MRRAAVLLLGLAACLDEDEVKLVDQGLVCVSSSRDLSQVMNPDEPALIRLTIAPRGCAVDESLSCSVDLQGRELVIRSVARWRETEECTLVQRFFSASCTTPPLSAGTYTLRFGQLEQPLVVDSETLAPPCFGEQFQ